MKTVSLAILAAASWLGTMSDVLACDDRTGIWATAEKDGVRHLIYGTRGVGFWSANFIEEWRNGKRAWRSKAGWGDFSNGWVKVWVMFKTRSGDNAGALEEQIGENGGERSEWIVLAGLARSVAEGGGLAVEWDEGFAPKDGERPGPTSNAYKFLGCLTEPIPLDKSTLFVANGVYNTYQRTRSLVPDNTFPTTPGSIWWMTGERIEAADFSCKVKSFDKDRTVAADCSNKATQAAREVKFSFTYDGDIVFLDGQRLDMVTD